MSKENNFMGFYAKVDFLGQRLTFVDFFSKNCKQMEKG
jgi:hypothetical protein